MAVLKNVTFAYVKIQKPVQKYETEGKENMEWTVDCVIDEKAAKAWNKQFKKQKAKTFDNDEFKDTFKIDPPFPDQDEQFVVKVKKNTHYKDKESGDTVPFPDKFKAKVYENVGTIEKPKLLDVTKTKLISNGSEGVVLYDIVENPKYGTFAKLKAIRIDNLIEYVAGDNMDELGELVEGEEVDAEDVDDFGDVDDDDDAPFDVEDSEEDSEY